MKTVYTPAFYRTYQQESRLAALEIVPYVCGLVRPERVIDVGCGVGTWLRIFLEQGVGHVTGLDGDHVERSMLQIPAERFFPHDLATPIRHRGRYDLAVSLEVAEHLPPYTARQFVADLTSLAPVVLFSAAIPHQGGDGHINEQWPDYWIDLFDEAGFAVVDCIRDRFWDNSAVAYYYAQNTFLYVRRDYLTAVHALQQTATGSVTVKARVHPRKWEEANDPARQPLRGLLSALPQALVAAIRRRLPPGWR